MSKPVNPTAKTLNPLVPPAILMSFALLAGTKHLIQYFEGASRGGLLLSAGLASAGTLYFDNNSSDERGALLGRTIAIAAGTFAAYIACKGLGGRVSLSFRSAVKFALIEAILVAPTSCATTQGKPKPTLTPQEKHQHYKHHMHEWNSLTAQQRAELVNEFYQNNFPVISLRNLELHQATLDVNLLNPTSPEWVTEILVTQDLGFLQQLRHDESADYTFLKETLFDQYPELAFLLNPQEFKMETGVYATLPSLKGRIQTQDDVNMLTLNQLKGYHKAFQKMSINYRNPAIHQAFLSAFRDWGMDPSDITFTTAISVYNRSGGEEKVTDMS